MFNGLYSYLGGYESQSCNVPMYLPVPLEGELTLWDPFLSFCRQQSKHQAVCSSAILPCQLEMNCGWVSMTCNFLRSEVKLPTSLGSTALGWSKFWWGADIQKDRIKYESNPLGEIRQFDIISVGGCWTLCEYSVNLSCPMDITKIPTTCNSKKRTSGFLVACHFVHLRFTGS